MSKRGISVFLTAVMIMGCLAVSAETAFIEESTEDIAPFEEELSVDEVSDEFISEDSEIFEETQDLLIEDPLDAEQESQELEEEEMPEDPAEQNEEPEEAALSNEDVTEAEKDGDFLSDEEETSIDSIITPQPAYITGLYNSKEGGDLRWEAQEGAEKYVILRTNGGKTETIATVGKGQTTYMDKTIKNNCWGKVYVYYVLSKIGNKTSGRGAGVTLQRLAPMEISSLKNDRDNTVTIKWKISTGTNKAFGYEIQYAASENDLYNRTGTFHKVQVDGRNNLSKAINNLSKDKTFYFRVRAYVDYIHSVTKVSTRTWSQYSKVKSVRITKGSHITPAPSSFTVGNIGYKVLSKSTVSVSGYFGSSSEVTIPQEVNGYRVAEIGQNAFRGNRSLVTVHIPESIEIINESAFADCISLRNMD